MRVPSCFLLALALASGLFAQNQVAGSLPGIARTFGSVVFPGGTAASMPGIQRTFGSVVFPGGGGPQIVVPSLTTAWPYGGPAARLAPAGRRAAAAYVYPIFWGGLYDSSYAYPSEPAVSQSPQNVTVVYPPQSGPVIINEYGTGSATAPGQTGSVVYSEPASQAQDASPAPGTYLLALKDHTVYEAVAYWVEGDTLHYFLAGNQHNQVSLSLIDRELTARLNKASGLVVTLPPEK
ncbi:MAG: hypothetical protein ABSC23_19350 [Bryobacteraceae bacterium]|jgi:hypothetical protein